MAARNDRLNRLVIRTPCPTSWEAMHGGDRARFCPYCNKHVHDLAALEARELEALIQATGGRFCARLPRGSAGPAVPLGPIATPARRASPLAAAVVGALVGLTGAAWAEAPPASPALAGAADAAPRPARPRQAGPAGAVLTGKVTDGDDSPLPGVEVAVRADGRDFTAYSAADGTFVLGDLPAGVYEIEARLDGFTFPAGTVRLQPGERRQLDLAGMATFSHDLGIVILDDEPPLRQLIQNSSLVVAGSVVSSAWTEAGRIRTELAVTAVLKGERGARLLTADHNRPPILTREGDELPQPGETVLAFLEGGPDGVHTATDAQYGLKRLPADALDAYRKRIAALAALGRLLPEPEETAEWLVATAEEPLTRKEAVTELEKAVATAEALARRRAEPGTPESEALDRWTAQSEPARIGAALTEAHRDRLVRALLATENPTAADLDLYELVRPWAGDEALGWLLRRFQQGAAAPDWLAHRMMRLLAEALDDPGLRQLVQEADQEIYQITWKAEPDAGERIAEVERDLRERFAQALKAR